MDTSLTEQDSQSEQALPEPQKGNSNRSSLYDWVEAAVFSLVLISLVFTFIARVVGVEGSSMESTLLDGDKLIITSYPITLNHGDIVIINRHTEQPIVKRVIGLPGDTVHIDRETHCVYLNGKQLDEQYLDPNTDTYPMELAKDIVVPEGRIFVLGDHRAVSLDSRYEEIGLIKKDDVMGRAMSRIWPFDRAGVMRHMEGKPVNAG